MALIDIKNLSFTYPLQQNKALDNISLSIDKGEFVLICGETGCGKSTLIRQIKSDIAPFGGLKGQIYYDNIPLEDLDKRKSSSEIGYVMQNPDNQIVTDKVWHELAFGLENLGIKSPIIRRRVAEMASFFGIESWFRRDVKDLSGGEKQLLNLASTMVMNPKLLILDEPTSQLDPIAAYDFINTLNKINKELALTIVLVEHRLEDVFPMADKILILEKGKKLIFDTPESIGENIRAFNVNNKIIHGFPSPIRIYSKLDTKDKCPLTIKDGTSWLSKNFNKSDIPLKSPSVGDNTKPMIELKDIWFRYKRDLPHVLRGLNVKINQGEVFSILGGNGTGKTTTLNIISGISQPYRGKILINNKKISDYKNMDLYRNNLAVLPQDPQTLFLTNKVSSEFDEIGKIMKLDKNSYNENVNTIAEKLNIKDLFNKHPYDLSGGEQQKLALAKILLLKPKIILMDEPTKGLDGYSKRVLGEIIKDLKEHNVTIVLVSHDVEFCAEYSDRCGLFFDGNIVSQDKPVEFFSENNFYTTAANRMSRHIFKNAITTEDVVKLCKAN